MTLSPENAWLFRITHIDNVPWILRHGLYCRSSDERDPAFRSIGNVDIIEKRARREVPIEPGGTLSDYVPFYFTPWSPMLLNIVTGRGVPLVSKEQIVVMVSSLPHLAASDVRCVFTDRHAYLQAACYYSEMKDLSHLDWKLLQDRDFSRDPQRPEKIERYQAEGLAHRHVPLHSLLGVACYNDAARKKLRDMADDAGAGLRVSVQGGWYF